MDVITITGTRAINPDTNYVRVFDQFLLPFVDTDAEFYVGGALGIDTEALRWLVAYVSNRVTVVVPNLLESQPVRAQEAIHQALESNKNRLIELNNPLNTASYYTRNRWMVDRADLVIGFPNRKSQNLGGTAYTLRYATDKGLPRLIIPI